MAANDEQELIDSNIKASSVTLKGLGNVDCCSYNYINSEKSIFNYSRLHLAMQESK